MKYIELVGWGTETTHLIPERAIASFTFSKQYTTIQFVSGNTLNIVESKEDIIILLSNLDSKFSTLDYSQDRVNFMFNQTDLSYEDWDASEKRMNIIGQNGNDGEHYD
tara:strand:- start:15 stop:338 length:324 start_codon:yes stop_codon:yes gene_type:complete